MKHHRRGDLSDVEGMKPSMILLTHLRGNIVRVHVNGIPPPDLCILHCPAFIQILPCIHAGRSAQSMSPVSTCVTTALPVASSGIPCQHTAGSLSGPPGTGQALLAQAMWYIHQAARHMPLEGVANVSAGLGVCSSRALLDARIPRMSAALTVRLQQAHELCKVLLWVGCPPDAPARRAWLGRRPGRLGVPAGALCSGSPRGMRDTLGVQPQPHVGARPPVRLHSAIRRSARPLCCRQPSQGISGTPLPAKLCGHRHPARLCLHGLIASPCPSQRNVQ